MDNATVKGYGPANLISLVKESRWEPTDDFGENFYGFTLGGYVLTKPADDLCPTGYRVTLTEMESEESIAMEGFCFRDMIEAFAANVTEAGVYKPNLIAGHQLSEQLSDDNTTLYEIRVDVLTD